MRPIGRVETVPLFPGLLAHLLEVLRGLTPEDWEKPTACKQWKVRDIAAHLLDGDLRKLSMGRDQYSTPPDSPIESYAHLTAYLNRLNADWVKAMARLSPRVLTQLLAFTGPQISAYFASLDPEAVAVYPVSWAGETTSLNWFDIGREYTERWHHQQQIRDAVGAPPLYERKWLHPLLALFVRALPHTYAKVEAAQGAAVRVVITGEAGDIWTLRRDESNWNLYEGQEDGASTQVTLSQDAAWRLFVKQLPPEAAAQEVTIKGEEELGKVFLSTVAVMA